MIVHYYNEWDKGAAAWLRELINNKLIPYGYVDERSITEVTPSDLEGFTQCHFFAGIGGWPLSLKLAGVPASTRLWTGSPPCQPFSVAGQSLGFDDERHLAPAFLRLIRECNPELLFGEQVAAAIGKHWLDFVFINLEDKGYSCGASVLPACSVGAPHKRDRLFFGACKLADTNSQRLQGGWPNSNAEGWQGQDFRQAGLCDGTGIGCVAYAESKGQSHGRERAAFTQPSKDGGEGSTTDANPHNCSWSGADWLGCQDGKFRPVESGTFPLANGIPSRVGRLRGYGNAIVPQVAAEFVKAFMESIR
ncbi:TPA: DNA cytosine methyltransferase [Salmonella enterica subsp. enterica serovar Waycross]